MKIKKFTFNTFQENTYVIESMNNCIIVDPGCSNKEEEETLSNYIKSENLEPIELINTHCHIDHIFGNNFISKKYNLKPKIHELDLPLLENAGLIAKSYGISLEQPDTDVTFIEEGDIIKLGNTNWEIIFTPGHAPGHICLLDKKNKKIISGDVLFNMSIGRTDLPLCNHDDLINSIKNKLLVLDDDTEVFCGHGQNTTIGFEKKHNPFL
jgi:glyoxylase-like metal-dependent hydrolase (beta-lactamase superfamily II)